jgi:hypothetical protein
MSTGRVYDWGSAAWHMRWCSCLIGRLAGSLLS